MSRRSRLWSRRSPAMADAGDGFGQKAFTVLELLVAAGITAILAGFIFVIIRNVSTTWTGATGRLGADAQARLVLDQLTVDLQSALFRDDGNVWFAVDVLNGATGNATNLWQSAVRNPKPTSGLSLDMTATRADLRPEDRGKLEQTRYGTAGIWLRFFTTSRGANIAATPASISAPVAVGYQIIRRFTATNPLNLNTAYLLHRAEVRPAATTGTSPRPGVLESGYNITSAAYTTSTVSTNNGATTGDPRSIQVPGSARNLDSVLADNVIDFGVRAYVRDVAQPSGLRLVFPATATGTLSNAGNARLRSVLPSNTPVDQWGTVHPFPEVLDVMLRVLTDDGAAKIANLEKNQTPPLIVPQKYNANAQQWWWGVAVENSRVYTRRIVLNAKPL
ncbi:MAG: hypothetical protein HY736_08675 [Verrucomicrobia bacterium]|nr:hypothetical protein [Verrucomicrobiota bacterium]